MKCIYVNFQTYVNIPVKYVQNCPVQIEIHKITYRYLCIQLKYTQNKNQCYYVNWFKNRTFIKWP